GEREKTGLKLEGVGAVNPVNGKKIPVFVADYVLMGYGTGAIMAVPAHDQRDWEFAVKYKVPIVEVIHSKDSSIAKCAYEGEGVMVNSGEFDGTPSVEGAEKVTKWLESKKLGKKAVNYRLKDWLISRQRYWGTPIPVIHCEKCGAVPVPEKDLPVVLPENVELTGEGKSPLSRIKDFIEVKCPKCGAPSKRETDTMDTFVDSSWYFARYTDAKNLKTPFDKKTADYWLPIDQYVGGVEHACMHLIYSRFWHKFMRDIGLLKSSEPFEKLLTQGMVTLGGAAMSKSRGNIVTPDEIIEKFGADTARLFILFAAPPEKQLDWSQEGLEGCWRFLNRVWRLIARKDELKSTKQKSGQRQERGSADAAVLKKTHQTIKKVTNDIVREHQLNTAISSIMELVNECYSSIDSCSDGVLETAQETVVLLLMPFAPHMCEELWEKMGHKKSLLEESWPESDEKYLIDDTIEIPVQVNGKLRATVSVVADITEEKLKEIVSVDPKITPYLEKGRLVKFIYVQKRIANLIVK
ncbi:MAG: leucine--tRNA ligase, partial [Endomicrobiales bacterium]|nr:leucine--tRNA ligase [Endomicrobiales bacterium]